MTTATLNRTDDLIVTKALVDHLREALPDSRLIELMSRVPEGTIIHADGTVE